MDENHDTPLHDASINEALDAIKYLILEYNCDPITSRNIVNDSPFHVASHIEIVKFLISVLHCDPNTLGHDNGTLLHFSAYYGDLDIVRYLINAEKCDPVCRDKYNDTMLLKL